MAPAEWTGLGGLGEVTWARAADAAVIAVGTSSGHLYLRRRGGAGWRWEHAGRPPGAVDVLGAALLPGTPAVLARDSKGDSRVWLHQPEAGRRPWTRLTGPDPDADLERFDSADIALSTTRLGAEVRDTLVVSSAAGRPWIRQGVDPGAAAWLQIAADADWIVVELATALASVASGAEPQQHIFAVTVDRETWDEIALRVAVLENSRWTWINPGSPPNDGFIHALSATSFRDGGGRLQACAAVIGTDDNAMMVTGSGRDWRWVDLGQAPGRHRIREAVLTDKGPDPRPGAEPVLVASASPGHLWARSLTGDWTDLGATPREGSVDPTAALELDGQRVWAAGVSSSSDLWTFESDDTGGHWEDHGRPAPAASVVGAHTDDFEILEKRRVVVHVIDANGALWSCDRWGRSGAGLSDSRGFWTRHGQPAPGVTCAEGVGVFTAGIGSARPTWAFVIGGDGRLWAKRGHRGGWTWVDHGAPPGRSIKTGVPPFAVDLLSGRPTVFALADDGRIWMSAEGPRWIDCGVPQGQLIFAIVGAAAPVSLAGLLPAAVVITGDGHLWITDSDGDAFHWTDLGTPAPSEKIVAGIGIEVVADLPDSSALDIAVGSQSGQVWCHRWARGRPSHWTKHGRPTDARIRSGIGTMPDPANPSGCLIAVVGGDQQIWVTPSTTPGAWTRWDPRPATTTITGGKAATLLDMPCAVVLDADRRVNIATPERT
ncbi:hypothetical protein [Actinomadura rubrisoli]|uniref:Uncharacterized protein n=1 Tax=Actinomadura rubrisoli TaxID=2530368 RepID=A0A4R5C5H3_9ACTN|nr:hypothetical protein [Actinomadura rubrisoli]TDD93343.1 hypothetical protein E1298_09800 [Actinomadura rubrisoli]